jgi:signal transduction histidine kinase
LSPNIRSISVDFSRMQPTPAVPQRSPPRGRLLGLAILLGAAVVLIVAFAAQLVFAVDVPWEHALQISVLHWTVPFGVLVLGAVLTRLAPLERRRLAWTVPLHLVVCAIVVTAAGQIEDEHVRTLRRHRVREFRAGPPPGDQPPPPPGQPAPVPPPIGHGMHPGEGGPPRRFFTMLATSRWQLHLAAYWVSVSLTSAWQQRRRAEERERKALELTAGLSQAKLDALRLQLQPHFLFNTLNAIATLVHRDPDAADEMITSLSDLLRLSLETTTAEVSLRRELELLERYLAIERVRLGDRLRVDQTIAPDTLDAAVPPLMLQTLVENAIRHGLEPRSAPGTVTIRAARDADKLRLTIADDGRGLPAADAQTERRGIGLANTEARLRELYGDDGRIRLLAPETGGVRVELELPWRAAPAPQTGAASR